MNLDTIGAVPVERLDERTRHAFLVRTYAHLFGAIALFTLIEVLLFTSGLALPIARLMLSGPWLLVLGGFVLVGWLARRTAYASVGLGAQYAALVGYVVAEAIVFVPLLVIATLKVPGAIQSAALITLFGFGLLTAMVFWTRQDLGFLGGILRWAGIMALVAIVAGAIFGFELGTFFSLAMIALAGASVLYDTSEIMHRYPQDRYVGAALDLFASVALMFWYVLRLFLSRRR
jgi:FtsH-binding integral membrane protein